MLRPRVQRQATTIGFQVDCVKHAEEGEGKVRLTAYYASTGKVTHCNIIRDVRTYSSSLLTVYINWKSNSPLCHKSTKRKNNSLLYNKGRKGKGKSLLHTCYKGKRENVTHCKITMIKGGNVTHCYIMRVEKGEVAYCNIK